MSLLRKIDIFGQFFNFPIHREEKLKTSIGGFFTILMLFISFTISFFLGKDFYYRTNPQIVATHISPENNPRYKLTNKNLTIAFRLEDDNGNFIDFSNYIFIKATFYEYKVSDYVFSQTNSHRFKIKKCTEVMKGTKTHLPKFQPEFWFCLDFDELSDKYLGGNFNTNEDMTEILFSVDSCNYDPNDNSTNINNEKLICRDAEELDEYFGNQQNKIFMNIMFPYVILNTDNLNSPVEISGHTHFKKIDYIMTFEEYCHLEYFEFQDDQGWISKSDQKQTFLTYKECSLNGKYVEKSSYTKDRMNELFEVIVTMNKVYANTRRKYMKIQDVFAITGGFITFMRLILSFLSASFNRLERSKILIDFYFGDKSKENNCSTNVNRNLKNAEVNFCKVNDNVDKTRNLINFKVNNYVNSNQIYSKSRRTNLFVKDNMNNSCNMTLKHCAESNLINIDNPPLEDKKKLNSKLSIISKAPVQSNLIDSNKNKKIFKKLHEPIGNDSSINIKNYKNINDSSNKIGTSDLVKKVLAISNFNNMNNNDYYNDNDKASYLKKENNLSQDRKIESVIFSSDFCKEKSPTMNQHKIEERGLREKIKIRKLLRVNYNFSEISFIKDTCFRKILTRNDQYKIIIDLFEKLEKKVLGKIDLIHYLKNLKYLKMMKNILFESNQRFYIKNYYDKAINFDKFKNDNVKTEEQMIKYFEDHNDSRISKRNFSFEDYLLNRINNQIFKDIESV